MTSLKFASPMLLLALFAIIGPVGFNSSPVNPVNDMTHSISQSMPQILSTSTTPRGITATLVHRDQFLNLSQSYRSSAEKMRDYARRSENCAHSLIRGRQLFHAPTSSPVGQPDEWETPLSDGAPSEYLMEISLGTPAQKFVGVADTGSNLAWVQCLPCLGCFNQSEKLFDPSLSSTYAQVSCSSSFCKFINESTDGCAYVSNTVETASNSTGCQYSYLYASGLTAGVLSQERSPWIHWTKMYKRKRTFGLVALMPLSVTTRSTTLTGFRVGQGLESYPSQLGQYFGHKFSYCLVIRSSDSSVVEESPLIFGDAAERESTVPLQFTPIISNPVQPFHTLYYVGIEGIRVNGTPVDIPADAFAINETDGSGETFIDSGTTLSYLFDEAFDPFLAAISDRIVDYERSNTAGTIIDPSYDLCYKASWASWVSEYRRKVPALSFQWANSTSFHLLAEGSWVHADSIVCLAIQRSPDSTANIFGNILQAGHLILYDLEKHQIGFSPANCTRHSL